VVEEVDRVDAVRGPWGLADQEGLEAREVDRFCKLDVQLVGVLAFLARLDGATFFLVEIDLNAMLGARELGGRPGRR
jgi:hypothetical protein